MIMRLQRYGKDRPRDVRNNTLASADNTISRYRKDLEM